MYLGKNITKNTNKNLLFKHNIGQIHHRIKYKTKEETHGWKHK